MRPGERGDPTNVGSGCVHCTCNTRSLPFLGIGLDRRAGLVHRAPRVSHHTLPVAVDIIVARRLQRTVFSEIIGIHWVAPWIVSLNVVILPSESRWWSPIVVPNQLCSSCNGKTSDCARIGFDPGNSFPRIWTPLLLDSAKPSPDSRALPFTGLLISRGSASWCRRSSPPGVDRNTHRSRDLRHPKQPTCIPLLPHR